MRYLYILSALLLSSLRLLAQDDLPEGRQEKIKALYVAYISQELKLTEEEAQKFWPVHTQYENEVKAVKQEASELDRQQTILNIKKKYQDKFVKILGASRTDDFYRTDAEFRKKLVDRLKKMRENGNQRLRKNQR